MRACTQHQLRSRLAAPRSICHIVRAPAHSGRSQLRRQQLTVHAGLSDIGKYLSEAASGVFKPTADTVPWSGGEFTGQIRHDAEYQRLKRVYEVVRNTRQQLSGCMDPQASNYNPNAAVEDGTCTYIFKDEASGEKIEGDLHKFITSTLSRLLDNNFKGDSSEPDWNKTDEWNKTYTYGGDLVSQRDIQRLLDYEKVVKKELEKAEANKPN